MGKNFTYSMFIVNLIGLAALVVASLIDFISGNRGLAILEAGLFAVYAFLLISVYRYLRRRKQPEFPQTPTPAQHLTDEDDAA